MKSVGDQPVTALVEYQVRTENTSVDEWLEVWNVRAEDARVGEPETMAYAAAVNVEDDTNVLVFERYAQGDRSLRAHIDRPAHAELMAMMSSRSMTKRRVMSTRFTDLAGYGWWSRPGPVSPAARGVALIITGFRFGSDADRSTSMELATPHIAYCWDEEPETLIHSAGIAIEDADRELDLRQGEMVLVIACTDLAAAERYAKDPRHLALGAQLVDAGVEIESTFSRTYVSTGHGFMWR